MLRSLRNLIRSFGYDVSRYKDTDRGIHPFLDMSHYVTKLDPVILDIGSNIGESIESFLSVFPSSHLYCFEPSNINFSSLIQKYSNQANIKLYNEALGSSISKSSFHDNEFPHMSSFLELGNYGYGKIINNRHIPISTVDNIAIREDLPFIDIIKIDVQGYELEVLKGSLNLFKTGNIKLVYVELTFIEIYVGLPRFESLIALLYENKFAFCGFYRQHFQDGLLSWADALFVRKD